MTGSLDFSTFITCIILSLGIAGPIMAATQFVDDFAVIGILGNNGAGKSTFAKCLSGLEKRRVAFWK